MNPIATQPILWHKYMEEGNERAGISICAPKKVEVITCVHHLMQSWFHNHHPSPITFHIPLQTFRVASSMKGAPSHFFSSNCSVDNWIQGWSSSLISCFLGWNVKIFLYGIMDWRSLWLVISSRMQK